ncbi:MAG: hypothetical protein A2312_02360 [Candidatus Staskawiczbacteria bacterium RIFOXYB2_FULL_32_9]|uniref:Uncharacterized protein n=1 Tax=Candidatus Staskawiczbacteria bacterium RIFOXYD1_FULL_32_13 TaxID=1802234 RepID=A0A1G2JMM2_9BACT|nr:MAG: hypothetical protein UR22_C0004G0051 [Parcubacteria group bacterium GW2011_GWC2_32_10]OGZ78244.1 MAG: hypothetical protein A2256_02995 [Candidatus Staskawiczbacteria bacterium RIFOXYA2_FULL_32_7]OGZ80971.1 MAG: hypothetical protein A2312_02360 [Candidatus Staskawiczbacteria bacterium RIFOXYB2_FULL_32_9]OGZ86541.1 MAG: hypothetical protein A2463_04235 [Candidatus Staskawiczbacteria bacterium RIFOXYC2_FULL_32_10]OGZ88359.1 MAG: hypothetical protein A2561_02045 [Candidatus Staskawiczbacter
MAKARDEARPHNPARVDRLRKFYEKNESQGKTPWPRTEELPEGEEEKVIITHYSRKGKQDEK